MLHVIRKFSVYNGKWGKKSTLCSLILFCYTLCAFVFVVWIFCLVSLGYTCGHTSPVSQGEAPSHCAWKFLSLSQWFPSCETLKSPLFHLLRISDAPTALCRQPGRIWLAQHGLRLPLPALGLGGSGRPPPPGALLSPLVRANKLILWYINPNIPISCFSPVHFLRNLFKWQDICEGIDCLFTNHMKFFGENV